MATLTHLPTARLLPCAARTHARLLPPVLALTAFTAIVGLSGCSMSRLTPASPAVAVTGMHGRVKGGQQPVTGATVQLYAVGATGNHSAATPLIIGDPVLTDAAGNFNITGDYTCPSASTQVYITATQGNPGLAPGTNNAAIALVNVLGSCGNLSSSTYITINEVTTAAAAFALAPFADSYFNVGSSASNSTGIANTMTNALLLADSSTGLSPAAALPATATVESDKLYTLANVLASCVNTDGTTGCPQLFSDTTYGGIPPTDIFGAALAIAQHPDTYVHDLFTLTTPQAPFPASGNEPNEWTMTIAYADPTMHTPRSIAIDQASNVWVLNNADGTLAGFTPQGAPLAGSPYTGDGTFQPSALAVDAGGNIWVTSPLATQDLVGVNRHPAVHPHPHAGSGGQNTVGTVTEFLSNGAQVTGSINYASADLNAPSSVAVDPFTGFIWIANANAQLSVLSAVDGSEQVPGAGSGWGTTNSSIGSANTVVLGNAGDAFVVANNLSIGVVGTTTGTLTSFSSSMQSQAPLAVAVDIEGNLWTGSGSAGPTGFLTTLNSAATQVGTDVTGGGLNNPTTLAIDSSDHVWMTNQMGANLSEFGATGAAEGNGTVLSPTSGLGLDAGIALAVGLAIDASGDLWVSDATNNRLVNFVGIAGPVATPLFAAPVAP